MIVVAVLETLPDHYPKEPIPASTRRCRAATPTCPISSPDPEIPREDPEPATGPGAAAARQIGGGGDQRGRGAAPSNTSRR